MHMLDDVAEAQRTCAGGRGDPQVRRTGRLHGGGEKIWPMDGEEDGKHTVEEDVVGDIIKPSLVTSGSFILAL